MVILFVGYALVPAPASAYAALEGPPVFSSAPGLPDGRVYEQVSPADKNGNEAGAGTTAYNVGALNHYGLAAPDGNSVLFEGTGPMGESPWGASELFVATKNEDETGWSTLAVLPRAQQPLAELGGLIKAHLLAYLDPSTDLSHAMVEVQEAAGTLASQPNETCRGQVYLTGPDPFVQATWLERPDVEDPVEDCGQYVGVPVGGTPDFSTVYFTYAGTLLAEDASRAPHAGQAWGLYEDREGVLREAGALPDGEPSPFGAVPAASGHGHAIAGNQVSADGSRVFFVSPDSAAVGSCEVTEEGKADSPAQAAAACAPQLYVRESGERTLLVSKDTLLPEAGGLPASAPSGVLQTPNPALQENAQTSLDGSYVFASPDGSQAFFQSQDALTGPAEEASPGSEPKTYDFDVDTGALTYLPGVVGEIITTDANGSLLAFVRPEVGGAPAELELWSAGAGGGSVRPVVRLPQPNATVPEARMSDEGSVLVFATASRLSGAFNSGGAEEIYRYDVPANTLGCMSCPPAGVTPRGAASFSALHTAEALSELHPGGEYTERPLSAMVDERGISSNGDRIFFESPDPLVPQDTNTNSPEVPISEEQKGPQGRDVYEWENGVVYLISTGKSPRDSYLLGSSESGNDVFFATTQSLVTGDTDGGYDVYDARVPRAGDNPPPPAVPCEGSVCQGSPSVPTPLTPPASATFSGLGNPAPEAAAPSPTPPTIKTVKCKKGYVRKKGKCIKQPKAKKSAKRDK